MNDSIRRPPMDPAAWPDPRPYAVLAVAVAFALGAADASAQNRPFCSKTSDRLERACENEVRDDFWVAAGNCLNRSSKRRACRREALEEREDALEECEASFDAREELCDLLGQASYDPEIDPDDFLSPAEIAAAPNPFLPLIPGTEWVYESEDETITVTVTDDTIELEGVTCVIVRDVVDEDGVPIEDTVDFFAQDKDGNVWYFGEISQNFEDGVLTDLDGSFRAGIEEAKAGIVMPADPQIGDAYRQEFALGEAEDWAQVTSRTGTGNAPAANCDGACLVTFEATPLEPAGAELKSYKAGIGLLFETDAITMERSAELVSFTTP